MAKASATLYIDSESLRLMVFEGGQVKEWSEIALAPGIMENSVVVKPEEFTGALQQLLEGHSLKSKKINVGISGFRCLTRPLSFPRLPEDMLDAAVRREADRSLPVPLEQLYLYWQILPSSTDEKLEIFVVAVPREVQDSILSAVVQAGLKPVYVDIKPLLLASLVRERTAVLVDVQKSEFDAVIIFEGMPQPVRTVLLPDEAENWSERLNTIMNEIDRTITFFRSSNPDQTLDTAAPIYVSGSLASENDMCEELSKQTRRNVIPLAAPIDVTEGLDPSHFMANISLYLRQTSPDTMGVSLVSLNVLPLAYRPQPISLNRVLAVPAAVVAIGLIAFMVLFNQNTAAAISTDEARLIDATSLLQQKQTEAQRLQSDITSLQNEIDQTAALQENMNSALTGLLKQRTAIDRDLDVTLSSQPNTVNLTSIGYITSILTISGNAPDEPSVLKYIQKLDDSGRFVDITVTGLTRDPAGYIDFTLLSILEPQAIGASILEIALGSLPRSIDLTSITSDADTIHLSGTSPDDEDVFIYLRALDASQRFSEITLSSMSLNLAGERDFSVILKGR